MRLKSTPHVFIALWLGLMCCIASCKHTDEGPNAFEEIPVELITEENLPKGLILKNGQIGLAEGYGICRRTALWR